ncbi:MAG TPA: metallophosphoesterase, partial [Bacillota bacterium]|nr:metallophosphoesterase [Bacillota bacterium]
MEMKDKITLKIVYTSDIHGNVLPINYSDNSPAEKGLLKLITAINSIEKENRILIDLGDSIQGSPLMYFHQLNREKYKNPIAQLFNYAKYDYFIPGNHDFNYGQDYLADFTESLNAKTLSQNILMDNELLFHQGFDIITLDDDVKVLIVGVTTKYIPNWENPTNIKDMVFLDPVEEVKKIVSKYKDDVQLIICAYHGGLEKDLHTKKQFVKDTGENQGFKLFEEIPEIDVLLTGHQHRQIVETIGNRVVLQPGGNGTNLGVVEVVFDSRKQIESIRPSLISAENLEVCQEGLKLVQDIESA